MLEIIDAERNERTYMTMPDERYRALRWAESFLQDLLDPAKTPRVPRDIRRQARAVLRHYPGAYYVDEIARRAPDIIAREMEQLHRFVKSGAQSLESSLPHPDQERDHTA